MPIRTCLVTGQRLDQSKLLRFTIREGEIVFDPNEYFSDNEKSLGASLEEKMNWSISKSIEEGRGGYVIKDLKAIGKLFHLKGKIAHFMKCKVKKLEK